MDLHIASKHMLEAYDGTSTIDGVEQSAGNVFVRTLVDDDTLIIVVRGTDTLRDWFDNMMCWKTPSAIGGNVHAGFQRHMLLARNLVYVPVTVSRVHVVGHSLGGAVGVLLGSLLATESPRRHVSVTTFGSPRIGDETFRRQCTYRSNLEVVRVFSPNDPVTWLPVVRFCHIGQAVRIEHRTGLSWLQSHAAREYDASARRGSRGD